MSISVGLDAVVFTVSHGVPRILAVRGPDGSLELPAGPLDSMVDASLEHSLRRWVLDLTDLQVGAVDQVYAFGDRDRDPRTSFGGDRRVSIAYMAMSEERAVADRATWIDVYALFPWEDHRGGEPVVMRSEIMPVLDGWAEASTSQETRSTRRERAGRLFGIWGCPWENAATLDRYDLLYEVGLVAEAKRDGGAQPGIVVVNSIEMAGDHRRIVAAAFGRLRTKLSHRPTVAEVVPETFSMRELREVVEALGGDQLNPQSFRRMLDRSGLIEETGEQTDTSGRPAQLYRFRA
jgi:hypothetical protein